MSSGQHSRSRRSSSTIPNKRAALYLRSSKDRADVSIDAQRRELKALALSKNLPIVAEFADVVLSGADEMRPGFQSLLREIQSRECRFSVLLALDTSRIARDEYLSALVHRECERRGIAIVYAKMPSDDPLTSVVMLNTMRGFDRYHRMVSRMKALAGMSENVRQGYRAGGRAPFGYRLESVPTGAVRDGAPVTKSRLAPTQDAERIGAYLRGRADGKSRTTLARELQLGLAATSLIGIEWNALTYAGATVWNVNQEKLDGGGYKGGTKRRPRDEWVVQEGTHVALITMAEAETILKRLETRPNKRATRATYLLTGLLFTPEGNPWYGNANKGGLYYRTDKRNVLASRVDQAVMTSVVADLQCDLFVKEATESCRRAQAPSTRAQEYLNAERELRAVTDHIDKLTRLLTQTDKPDPLLRTIETLEREREELVEHTAQLQVETEREKQLAAITEADVKRTLETLARNLEDIAHESQDLLKEFLGSIVERIELHPTDLTCRIQYRISQTSGNKVASPRGFEPRLPP
jgi:site-specific DNA recombinase